MKKNPGRKERRKAMRHKRRRGYTRGPKWLRQFVGKYGMTPEEVDYWTEVDETLWTGIRSSFLKALAKAKKKRMGVL